MTLLTKLYDVVNRNQGKGRIHIYRPTVAEFFMSDSDFNSPLVEALPTSSGINTYPNMNQGDSMVVNHAGNKISLKDVKILKLDGGLQGLINSSLDFDLSDESKFTQENSTNGTDFGDGIVQLSSVQVPLANPLTNDWLMYHGTLQLSGDGLTVTRTIGNQWLGAKVRHGIHTGKWYFEIKINTKVDNYLNVGLVTYSTTTSLNHTLGGWSWRAQDSGPAIYENGTLMTYSDGGYSQGDTLGFAVDLTTDSLYLRRNGVWLRGRAPGGTALASLAGRAGKTLVPGVGTYYYNGSGAQGDSVTFNFGKNGFKYSLPSGYNIETVDEFTTVQPYNITTSDQNHIDLSTIDLINSVTITDDQPINTSIRCLVSFDGRATWYRWNGSSWVLVANGLTDLQTGNTISELEAGFIDLDITNEISLDFAFDLSTSDSSVTPSIDQITINYDEVGGYVLTNMDDYLVENLGFNQTRVTKLSSGTESSVKVICTIN